MGKKIKIVLHYSHGAKLICCYLVWCYVILLCFREQVICPSGFLRTTVAQQLMMAFTHMNSKYVKHLSSKISAHECGPCKGICYLQCPKCPGVLSTDIPTNSRCILKILRTAKEWMSFNLTNQWLSSNIQIYISYMAFKENDCPFKCHVTAANSLIGYWCVSQLQSHFRSPSYNSVNYYKHTEKKILM